MQWKGERLTLRPIRPEDAAQHQAFMAALRPEDLRLRFFSVRRQIPPAEMEHLTHIDYAHEMAFIAERRLPGGMAQTLGVVRAVADADNVSAEFAIVVRPDIQARGLGCQLMRKMITYQAGRGTQRMVGYVLRENVGMRSLAKALGFVVDAGASDADALHVVLALQDMP